MKRKKLNRQHDAVWIRVLDVSRFLSVYSLNGWVFQWGLKSKHLLVPYWLGTGEVPGSNPSKGENFSVKKLTGLFKFEYEYVIWNVCVLMTKI